MYPLSLLLLEIQREFFAELRLRYFHGTNYFHVVFCHDTLAYDLMYN